MIMPEFKTDIDQVREALEDWVHTYAPELSDESCVAKSRNRIARDGTIGYISRVIALLSGKVLVDREAIKNYIKYYLPIANGDGLRGFYTLPISDEDVENELTYFENVELRRSRQTIEVPDGIENPTIVDRDRLKEEYRMNIAQYHAPSNHKNRSFENFLAYLRREGEDNAAKKI